MEKKKGCIMQTVISRIQDPVRAAAYFEDKLAFTAGPVELERMIKSCENIVIVDVRDAEDFAKGHIPGAINLPKGTWDQAMGLNKHRTNVVYCYSLLCHLAANACLEFASKGYPVMELEGGFTSWEEGGFEIEHETTNRLKKVHERLLHRRHMVART